MAISIDTNEFKIPEKGVSSPAHLERWLESQAYQDIMGFLQVMNSSVKGKGCSSQCTTSTVVNKLIEMLDKLSNMISEFPPLEQPQRYGNKAFRNYYEKAKQIAEDLVKEALGEEFNKAAGEISVYLVESLGNSTRIDYGTGHELSFIMFLTCLYKINALKQEDSVATVNKVFKRYVELARELQTSYKMEPAGSQGVWSLDDYQFVPFIWGASQLMMNPRIMPEMITQPSCVEENAEEFLFLACIKYILKVKTGPFAEHSNQLWNISGVQSWTKVNQGLIKMYKDEVLRKFPVIQHVLFGSILTLAPCKPKTLSTDPFQLLK